jgi:hypothetical protein
MHNRLTEVIQGRCVAIVLVATVVVIIDPLQVATMDRCETSFQETTSNLAVQTRVRLIIGDRDLAKLRNTNIFKVELQIAISQ